MADLIYMKVTGKKQGLISSGCGTGNSIGNRYQKNHPDEIFVFGVQHLMSRSQNVNHHPVTVNKPIDKASPLLAKSIDENEELTCEIDFFRTSPSGGLEKYYSMRLGRAKIESIRCDYPHSVDSNQLCPQEIISISYADISWRHLTGSTEAYSFWQDRVY